MYVYQCMSMAMCLQGSQCHHRKSKCKHWWICLLWVLFITDMEEGKSRAHLLSLRGIRIIIDRYRLWYVSSIPAIFFLLFVHKEMRWDTNDMLYRWQCFIAVPAVVCWFKLADWIFEDEDKYISRMINNVGRSRGWWLILQKLTHG